MKQKLDPAEVWDKAHNYVFGGIFYLCFFGFIAFVVLGVVGNLFVK